MTSLPEQLSAARKWQFEAQLDLIRAVTTQVFESTGQVIALNLDASRAAVERSSNAVKQLFEVNDPRDLMALGSHSQEQFQQMLAYSRELFSIAAAVPASLVRQAGAGVQAPAARQAGAAAPAPAAEQASPAAAASPWPAPDARAADEATPAARGVKPSKKPVVATPPEAEPQPAAKAKPIAGAASKVVPKAAGAQHPLSSPVAQAGGPVEVPLVKPVEAAPPPAPVAGTPEIESMKADSAPSKADRKK